MERTRDFRRRKVAMIKKQVRKQLRVKANPHITDKHIGLLATTPQICSGPDCCGNVRHSHRWPQVTKQEMQVDISTQEYLDEIDACANLKDLIYEP